MIISDIAILSGSFGALLFLIIGWPLAQGLGILKVLLGGAIAQGILAATIGVVCAPYAEENFPELDSYVHKLERFVDAQIISRL